MYTNVLQILLVAAKIQLELEVLHVIVRLIKEVILEIWTLHKFLPIRKDMLLQNLYMEKMFRKDLVIAIFIHNIVRMEKSFYRVIIIVLVHQVHLFIVWTEMRYTQTQIQVN